MSTITAPQKSARQTSPSQPPRGKKKSSIRTTVTLSPEAVEIVERLKTTAGFSTSGAIEELILRSEPQNDWLVEKDGFLLFDPPLKGGKLTSERVKQLLEEGPY